MASEISSADEIQQLRARLAEAEATVDAIRSGTVDALVVDGPNGPQIFTLKGAEEPYRILVERMREGALTLAEDGSVVYSNQHFAELIGLPLQQVIGKDVASFVKQDDRATLRALLDGAEAGGRREMRLLRGDGSVCPAFVSLSRSPVGDVSAFFAVVTDLTEQKRSEQVAAAERFARSILEHATEAMIVCDESGRVIHVSRAAEGLTARRPVGLPFLDAFCLEPAPNPADAEPPSIADVIRAALAGRSARGIEVRPIAEAGRMRHFLFSAGPLYSGRAEPIGCIVTLTDITERKRAEERQRLLLAELNHRVKNNLAIVRSVASQTLVSSASLEAFKGAFDGRLKALALAHSVLTKTDWGRADLMELVTRSVAPYRHLGPEEDIVVSGPPVWLPSQCVPALAMILHELATNAAKYGALSVKTGRIEIAWRLEPREDDSQVSLSWSERNGPPVRPPNRRGFGTTLITRTASHDLGGTAELDYAAAGFRCRLAFPLQGGRAADPLHVGAAETGVGPGWAQNR